MRISDWSSDVCSSDLADVGVLSGGGSSQVRSVGGAPVEIPLTEGAAASFARVTWHASSPLKAIRAMAPDAEVTYVDGSDPVAAAQAAAGADVAIVFATTWQFGRRAGRERLSRQGSYWWAPVN